MRYYLLTDANATEPAVRGHYKTPLRDGIYRAMRRGESSYIRNRATASDFRAGRGQTESGKAALLGTRNEVDRGWRAASDILERQGEPALAIAARRFRHQMPAPQADREQLATEILKFAHRHPTDRTRQSPVR